MVLRILENCGLLGQCRLPPRPELEYTQGYPQHMGTWQGQFGKPAAMLLAECRVQ